MNYNDQRRQEKSWNDPPMFSMEQLNKAANTIPVNKRYRYPQQPISSIPQGQMMPQSISSYPQTTTSSSYIGYNSSIAPIPSAFQSQQPSQQYSSYSYGAPASNPYSPLNPLMNQSVGVQQPTLPQNYNYLSQNQYPTSSIYPIPAPNANVQTSNQPLRSVVQRGFVNNPPSTMSSLYGSPSSTVQQPVSNASAPTMGFNFNTSTQSVPQAPSMSPPGAPGFNYNNGNSQQQSSYPQTQTVTQQQYPYPQY